MKKFISAACIAAALLSGYSIYHTSNKSKIDSVVLENIEALANGDAGGYSCSVSSKCYLFGGVDGSVSCTGIRKCIRGFEYVSCDGNITSCHTY